MPTNNFLPFGIDPAANVITQGAYAALPARINGFLAGVAQSAQLNKAWRQGSVMAAVIGQFINDYGALDALDDGNVTNLVRDFARSLQGASYLLGVATGTANAWVLTPIPSVAAYAAGRPMLVTIPATNTSTTVNAAVSGLANRRVKKSDGSDPAIGDLIGGRMIWVADDGASLRVLSPLPSDVVAQAALNAPFVQIGAGSGNYVPGAGVTRLRVRGVAPGGSGGASNNSTAGGTILGNAGAGAGAGAAFEAIIACAPGIAIPWSIGSPGAAVPNGSGLDGGSLSFGSVGVNALITAGGGKGGSFGSASKGAGGVGGTITSSGSSILSIIAVNGGNGGVSGQNSATPSTSDNLIQFVDGGISGLGFSQVQKGNTGSPGGGLGAGGSGASGGSGLAGGAGANGGLTIEANP